MLSIAAFLSVPTKRTCPVSVWVPGFVTSSLPHASKSIGITRSRIEPTPLLVRRNSDDRFTPEMISLQCAGTNAPKGSAQRHSPVRAKASPRQAPQHCHDGGIPTARIQGALERPLLELAVHELVPVFGAKGPTTQEEGSAGPRRRARDVPIRPAPAERSSALRSRQRLL